MERWQADRIDSIQVRHMVKIGDSKVDHTEVYHHCHRRPCPTAQQVGRQNGVRPVSRMLRHESRALQEAESQLALSRGQADRQKVAWRRREIGRLRGHVMGANLSLSG